MAASNRMRTALVLAAVAAAAGAGATLAARKQASTIRSNPDPYPYEVLSVEPVGQTTWVDRPDGTRLRVITAGSGPTVVLAHGFAVTLIEWNVVATMLLERGYRVVAFDQRGHGQSTIGSDGVGSQQMAEDYLAVLEAVDAHDAVLVGHSMGGFLAVKAMVDVPGVAERLAGLILFSTFAGDVLNGAPQNRAQIPMIKAGMLQKAIRNETVGTLFGASICGDEPSPACVRVFLEVFRDSDLISLMPILEAFGAEDRGPRLGEITVPTIVMCGTSDKTTPPRQSQRLADGIPGASMIWIDGKGHMLNWEAPEALVEAIAALLPVSA